MKLPIKPIGIIRSPYRRKADAPIQGRMASRVRGTVEVANKYAPALKDVESFSHLILIYHFNQAGPIKLVRPTFLDERPHGLFASRHPCRPNGLGLTVVKLVKRQGRRLVVSGIDVLDKTPLLDIKPYLPQYDSHPRARRGWTAGKKKRKKPSGRE